jgi:hypothetical protein
VITLAVSAYGVVDPWLFFLNLDADPRIRRSKVYISKKSVGLFYMDVVIFATDILEKAEQSGLL